MGIIFLYVLWFAIAVVSILIATIVFREH